MISGDSFAKIVFVMFIDLNCPHCDCYEFIEKRERILNL
ncbi:hypothetical protein [Acinetobacter sp. C32I]